MKKGRRSVANCFLFFFLGNVCFYLGNRLTYSAKGGNTKEKKYYQLLDNWMILLEKKSNIAEYFCKRNIKEIAVYGYGSVGRHLVTQLLKSDVNVKYVIDKRVGDKENGIERYLPTDKIPEVEAIVVTPVAEYQEIEEKLQRRFSGEIISVEDIVYDML